MSTTLFPAYAAVFFGAALALILAVPFTAVQYRRRGGLTVGLVLLDVLVLLYLVALIAYTLLPLPLRVPDFCAVHQATPQLMPGQFVSDIIRESASRGGGVTSYLKNPAVLQFAFNVALFLPLGMIVRYFTKRPIAVVALIGLGASLLIETTQITGNWFLYPCAYRLFDVDDLIANTTGAFLGAFLAPLLRLMPGQVAMNREDPRPVTLLRRLLGMLCDWLIVTLGAVALVFVYLVVLPDRSAIPTSADTFLRLAAGPVILAALQLAWTLTAGRTIGETAIRVEPATPTRPTGRLLRWAAGIGGYTLLSLIPSTLVSVVLAVFVLVSIVLVITTSQHRGLAYVLNRWEIQDDRADTTIEKTPMPGGVRPRPE